MSNMNKVVGTLGAKIALSVFFALVAWAYVYFLLAPALWRLYWDSSRTVSDYATMIALVCLLAVWVVSYVLTMKTVFGKTTPKQFSPVDVAKLTSTQEQALVAAWWWLVKNRTQQAALADKADVYAVDRPNGGVFVNINFECPPAQKRLFYGFGVVFDAAGHPVVTLEGDSENN